MKIILCLLLVFIAQAQAADWHKLEGIYALTPSAYLNPAEDAIEDSHLRLQLKGKSAEDLYHAMQGEPVVDDCTGGLAKNAGAMQCLYFKGGVSYECHFSINLMKQAIEYGVAC